MGNKDHTDLNMLTPLVEESVKLKQKMKALECHMSHNLTAFECMFVCLTLKYAIQFRFTVHP